MGREPRRPDRHVDRSRRPATSGTTAAGGPPIGLAAAPGRSWILDALGPDRRPERARRRDTRGPHPERAETDDPEPCRLLPDPRRLQAGHGLDVRRPREYQAVGVVSGSGLGHECTDAVRSFEYRTTVAVPASSGRPARSRVGPGTISRTGIGPIAAGQGDASGSPTPTEPVLVSDDRASNRPDRIDPRSGRAARRAIDARTRRVWLARTRRSSDTLQRPAIESIASYTVGGTNRGPSRLARHESGSPTAGPDSPAWSIQDRRPSLADIGRWPPGRCRDRSGRLVWVTIQAP